MPLTSHSFSRTRVERPIAVLRVVLAATSLFAIWLDPAEPARFVQTTYSLHAAYLAYSIGIAAIVWNRLSGVVVGVLTALLLSVLLLYEIQAAGNPSGGGTPDDLQAQVHDTVKASRLAVPLMNAIYKPIVAIFQPVLPTDPHQYFSRGPVS